MRLRNLSNRPYIGILPATPAGMISRVKSRIAGTVVGLGSALLVTTCSQPADPTQGCSPPSNIDLSSEVHAYLGHPVAVTARMTRSAGDKSCWLAQWGDGKADSGTFSDTATQITVTHQYAAAGHYLVKVGGMSAATSTSAATVSAMVDLPGTPEVLLAGGDIGECGLPHAEAAAKILDTISGTIIPLGDAAYPSGSASDYSGCYAPTWGRHKGRTYPAPGNHDYVKRDSSGYFGYFGLAAGDPARGYYSFDLGAWHIISLNSNIARTAGSTQEKWLRADLASHPSQCTLAYWHSP